MALSALTYTALRQSVRDFLAKSNLTEVLPDFIYLAELRLFRRLRLLGMEDVETGSLTADVEMLALPTGYRRTRALYIDGDPHGPLKILSPDEFYRNRLSWESGKPSLMTFIGDTIRLGPTPDSAYSYVHHYSGSPQHLSDAAPVNWLLQNAPDLYLYASLLEAEPYLKNDPRTALWRAFVEEAIQDLEREDEAKRWTGAPLVPRAA